MIQGGCYQPVGLSLGFDFWSGVAPALTRDGDAPFVDEIHGNRSTMSTL